MSDRKLALVTGGSRGIGRAVCVKLAEIGMDIVFSYQSDAPAAEETERLCEEKGARVLKVQADVSNSDQCDRLIAQASWFGGGHIDVLVNNAGITRDGLTMRMENEDFDAVVNVNLKGTFYMMRGVSRFMIRARRGRIVNMSSVVGVRGNAGQLNYAASTSGVIGMTKSLAKELASRGITVNAVAPGFIETDMTGKMTANARDASLAEIPMGGAGRVEDVACAVAFFAGEESRYITGQVLCVDGGMAI